MKTIYLFWCAIIVASTLTAQSESGIVEFDQISSFDVNNKIVINLKAKLSEDVVILEKEYIVSSDRVKAINKRFTQEENTSGRIITVTHNGMKDFSGEWVELIKVLINEPTVLKLREYEEENFQMLVNESFDSKSLEKIAAKANWPIRLSE